jgi:putative ABC transport system permease protein
MIVRHRWSRLVFGVLLRLYPAEFRARFRRDLEADFTELLAQRGRRAAWSRALHDLAPSLRITHVDAQATAGRRLYTHRPGDSVGASVLFDLRHAVRALARAPGFTAVVVLTLAMGIGANSAMFTLVNAALLRPLGFHEADRLMLIYEAIPARGVDRFGVSPPDYLDLRAMQMSFSAIGAYRVSPFELSGTETSERVAVAQVSGEVFPLLGVNATVGRTLTTNDDGANARVAVISHGLWQRRFASGDVLQQQITLDRQPYLIVGVMPAAFQFPKRGAELNGEPADVFVPLVFNPFERQARGMMYNYSVLARLKPGVSARQANADTSALALRIRDNYPAVVREAMQSLAITAVPLRDDLSGPVRTPLLILLAAVALVLLVACANVANLVLSRAVVRSREIGLRVALGAAQRRLVQMLLAESLLLAALAGGLGLLIGQWVLRTVPLALAASLPAVHDVTLDWRVVAFTFVISAATAGVFGLVPLAAGARRDVHDLLREGTARLTASARQHRVQAVCVVASVALALVLLAGAGLLVRSVNNLLALDTGVRADNVLTMKVALPYAGYNSGPVVRNFLRALHERVSVLPGVRAAVLATDLPVTGEGERRAFTPEHGVDAANAPGVAVTWVYGDYFATYGVPIVRGRTFTPEEQTENRQVAVVSAGVAERFWPGQDPIGRRIKWGLPGSAAPWNEVIGIAGDVIDGPITSTPIIHVYVPYADVPDAALGAPVGGLLRQVTIGAHAETDAAALTSSVRAAVASLDRSLALTDVTTMEDVVREVTAPQRFSAAVMALFAAGALLMAGIGLYGVLAFTVAQRTREMGVRLALGARAGEVLRLVIREGMTLAAVGLVCGLAGAVAAVRLLSAQLFRTEVYDPVTFVAAPLVLALAALLACYVPARRAATVDPIAALRAE